MRQRTTLSNRILQPMLLLLFLVFSVTLAGPTYGQTLEHLNLDTSGLNTRVGESPFVSSNGRYVVFTGSYLLAEDLHGLQVYLYDRDLDVLELVSQAADGTSANSSVVLPDYEGARAVTEDGRYVVFRTMATNLPGVPNPNNLRHVWVRDRGTGTTILISKDSAGNPANQRSWDFSIAPDGWAVLFNSSADNLDPLDPDNFSNTFLHEMSGSTTKLACFDVFGDKINNCSKISLSCTGLMTFLSPNDDAAPDDLHPGFDVFFGNPLAGNNVIISVDPSGGPATSTVFSSPSISCDGQRIAFATQASLATADMDTDWDLYVHDIGTGTSWLLRAPADTSLRASEISMSPSGRWLGFRTAAELDAIDSNGFDDIYAVSYSPDRALGTPRLVSQTNGQQGNFQSTSQAIANNGAVAFESRSTNFGAGTDLNGTGSDVFVNPHVLFSDDFESADTSRWSSAIP